MGPIKPELALPAFQELSHMGVPAWATAIKTCLDKTAADPASRYAQLATVDTLGKPHLRNLVIRGCLGELTIASTSPNAIDFWMVTDQRSSKFHELISQPEVEVCWYFADPREQFRLTGLISMDMVSDSPTRLKAWQSISTQAKVGFYWPKPLEKRDPFNEKSFQVGQDEMESANPPESFVVLTLHVTKVDHLILRGDPQNRYIHNFHPVHGWNQMEVNP